MFFFFLVIFAMLYMAGELNIFSVAILFGLTYLYRILRTNEDTAEEIRELRFELMQPKARTAEQSYRDYMCEPTQEPKIQTLVDAAREHLRVCKIPGCAGLHRSHV